jgi:hypothetical protein
MDDAQQIALLERMEAELLRPRGHDIATVPLFHYTDAAGLSGIMAKKQVWASHVRHLNDRDELFIGERIVEAEAKRLLADVSAYPWQEWFLKNFIQIHESARLSQIAEIFVASFSENGDSLPQWRGYGSNGSGYSIGFHGFRLPTGDAPDAQAALTLAKVVYDKDDFRALARHQLLDVAKGFQRFLNEFATQGSHAEAFAKRALRIALQRIGAIVPKLKNSAFREEREWRLIAVPMPRREREIVCFRSGRSGLLPYMEIDLAEDSAQMQIARVVVGPTQDEERGMHGVRMILKHHGYDASLAIQSRVPFRG